MKLKPIISVFLIGFFIVILNSTLWGATEHIVVVLEENHDYKQAMSESGMSYLYNLSKEYASANQFFANTHPSIGNYFMLTMGKVLTNDDKFMDTVDADNIARHLISSGKTWKSYAEGIPSVGYVGGNIAATRYIARHNPLSFFSDVRSDPKQAQNIVPFSQFAKDVEANNLPNFSFIVPNGDDDAHNKGSTLQGADEWLKDNIDPLLKSSEFQKSGLLVITFDEASGKDKLHGGGQIACVLVGTQVKKHYTSDTVYQHESLLALFCKELGLSRPWPGSSETAPSMDEFLTPAQ